MHFRSSILVHSLGIRTIANGVANTYQDSETVLYLGGAHEISVKTRNADEKDVSQLSDHELRLVCQATGKWEPSSQEIRTAFEALSEGRFPNRTESLEELQRELDDAVEEGRISGYSFPWDVLPASLQDFINHVASELRQAARKTADALRWRYGILGPHSPYSSWKPEWSFDGEQWHTLPHAVQLQVELESAGTVHVTDEVRADVEVLLSQEVAEPLGHDLFREAWELRDRNPRSALVIGVASLEVGFKSLVAELVPEAAWLVENLPAPRIGKMLKDYLPELPAKCTIEGGVLPPPRKLRNSIEEAAEKRNKVAHTSSAALKPEVLKEWLLAIRDVLWLLDYYRGFQWASTHIREETKKQMGL